jgi:predicted ester cyclase
MKPFAAFAVAAIVLVAVETRRRRRRSPEDVVRAYYEAWADGDADAIDSVVAGSYHGHVNALAGIEERDRAALADQVRAHHEAFPESRFEVEEIVADGNRLAARVRMRGTHAGDEHEGEMRGLVLLRLEDGKIAEEWASWDYLGLARQLGVEVQ